MSSPARPRVILASASPARLTLLRAAGLDPEVRVSAVDEDAIEAQLASEGTTAPDQICLALALAKTAVVAEQIRSESRSSVPTLVIGCDSVLDIDGRALGKPADAAEATARWRQMRGRAAMLCTGHAVALIGSVPDEDRIAQAVAATMVQFAAIDDGTIAAYVATGEPLRVAGAFTLDGLGGPFVEFIEGDHSNVVGLSLPLTRHLVSELGIGWTDLWAQN